MQVQILDRWEESSRRSSLKKNKKKKRIKIKLKEVVK